MIQGEVSDETVIQGLTISGYGSGVYLYGQESNPPKPMLRDLVITQNLKNAVKSARAIFTVERCLIVDNVYSDRLFYLFFGGQATVRNCTFVGNIGDYPVIQSFSGGDAVIENVLIWGNVNSFNDNPSTGIDSGFSGESYSVKNSLIEGGYADGTDIIDSDPIFVDVSQGDFRLQKESPAIGAGVNGADIGAFAFVPPPLGPKVRSRLRYHSFGHLPENPAMSDFDLAELGNVTRLLLDMAGEENDLVVLDSINDYLPGLDTLNLYSAHFDSLRPIDGHQNLRRLELKASSSPNTMFSKDENDQPINLPNLQELDLRETDFWSVDSLRHLTSLKRLYLANTAIEDGDLEGLEDLINLDFLDLRQNSDISDITDIKKLAEAKNRVQADKDHQDWGVNTAAAPAANQSALDHEEWHNAKASWTLLVEGTSISPSHVDELMDMGVRVWTLPQQQASISLLSGVNMIGVPLDSRGSLTSARRLIDDRLRRHYIHWSDHIPQSSDNGEPYIQNADIQENLKANASNLGWPSGQPLRAAFQGWADGADGYGPDNFQCMVRVIPVDSWIWNMDSESYQALETDLNNAVSIGDIKTIMEDVWGKTSVYDYLLQVRAAYQADGSYWSHTLDAQLVESADGNLQLVRYRDVGWIVNHDPVEQRFNTFIPEFDHNNDGFPIRGGEGYIVQVGSNRQVDFYGQAWTGNLGEAPSAKVGHNIWAFMVVGELTKEMITESDVYQLRATNLNSGKQLAAIEHQGYRFRLPLVDMNRQDVVVAGDLVKIEVIDGTGKRIADSQFTVGQQEIATAYRLVRMQYNPVPEFTRLLQNYPNPFNPETWIPFELSQDAEVSITIYDVSGKLIQTLEVGFQPAGIYSSQAKAAYWDGKTKTGETVASGVYFYNIRLGDYSETRRMVILK